MVYMYTHLPFLYNPRIPRNSSISSTRGLIKPGADYWDCWPLNHWLLTTRSHPTRYTYTIIDLPFLCHAKNSLSATLYPYSLTLSSKNKQYDFAPLIPFQKQYPQSHYLHYFPLSPFHPIISIYYAVCHLRGWHQHISCVRRVVMFEPRQYVTSTCQVGTSSRIPSRIHSCLFISSWGEVGGWGRDPKKCTGRDWGMGSSTI